MKDIQVEIMKKYSCILFRYCRKGTSKNLAATQQFEFLEVISIHTLSTFNSMAIAISSLMKSSFKFSNIFFDL